jgi:Zn-dependent peptidase ImmA (M78 family)
MIEDLQREDLLGTVDRVVEELLEAATVAGPPVDAIRLAQEHLGIVVCLDERQGQRGRAQRAAGVKQIFLRPEPTLERHQWTVAHEIGEHVKPSLLRRIGIEPEQTRAMTGESLANLFAYHLLVPSRWFREDAPLVNYDLPALKERYQTASHEVVAWRLLDLPEPCVITIFDNETIHRRRSNSWRVTRRLEPAEQDCQRYVHSHGRAKTVRKTGCTVQGWPVHREGWKREILRSVYEEVD